MRLLLFDRIEHGPEDWVVIDHQVALLASRHSFRDDLLQVLSGVFIWFLLFLGPLIGGTVGEVILRASGRKRGLKLEIVAGASVVLGALLALLVSHMWVVMLANPVSLVLYLVAVALTAAAAVGKIRFL